MAEKLIRGYHDPMSFSSLNLPIVLLYHEVSPASNPYLNQYFINLNPVAFRDHMRALKRYYRPIGFPELLQAWSLGDDVRDRILVTFDDGYRDAVRYAGEILTELDLPSVWFVNSDFWSNRTVFWLSQLYWVYEQGLLEDFHRLANKRWPDLLTPLPPGDINLWAKDNYSKKLAGFLTEYAQRFGFDETAAAQRGGLYAEPGELKALSQFAEIGNHTATHPNCANLTMTELKNEIGDCHQAIAGILGQAPRAMAYPFGVPAAHWSPLSNWVVKSFGYDTIFSVAEPAGLVSSGLWAGAVPRHAVPLGPVTQGDFRRYVDGLSA